jgi:glycosyltransferase involved in cell wall biosynthesis
MRILVHAPLKPPDHPVASGERTMARLLVEALAQAGYRPEWASHLRMLDRHGDEALMQRLADEAKAQAQALIAQANAPGAERPVAFFTYHVFYKAPDLIGPLVSRALGIPYVVAEGSRAPKRAGGRFALGHALAEAALDLADAVLVLNEADRAMLERHRPAHQRLVEFPPFLDVEAWPAPASRRPGKTPRLLAVAMMRPGDKLASYRLLASALLGLQDRPWQLEIAGDGPARADVEALFAPFGERVRWLGLIEDRDKLAQAYAKADLLVWPAVNEAFGMVFLEAATQACPALAGDFGGVRAMVRDGETGAVVPGGDAAAFAEALRALIARPARLREWGENARRFVQRERAIGPAALRLRAVLDPLIEAARQPAP